MRPAVTTEEQVPLSPLTTFGIGGPARYLARVSGVEELREALRAAKARGAQVLLLGGGSNLLLPDRGFDGFVIKLESRGIAQQGEELSAAAGESWDELVARAVSLGLWGLENLSGIPGTVGGAVVQGIGAYGASIGETLAWVDVLDTASEAVRRLDKAACEFDYRTSVFKREEGRFVVLAAGFALSRVPRPNTSYRDLRERFGDAAPALPAIRDAVLGIRAAKFPDLSVEGTAGSFFKNPIVPAEAAQALQRTYPGLPVFAMPETAGVKVPLAWLFDHVLGLKGRAVGGARLFERQPLVIAASRGATAADVLALARAVQEAAREKLGVAIEPEVKIIL